jgi:hypothetical protein
MTPGKPAATVPAVTPISKARRLRWIIGSSSHVDHDGLKVRFAAIIRCPAHALTPVTVSGVTWMRCRIPPDAQPYDAYLLPAALCCRCVPVGPAPTTKQGTVSV